LANGAALAAPRFTVRLASTAPDGTAWSRELKDFAREAAEKSGGELEVKLYLGGIAGSEAGAEERVRRGQLDGVISGGMMCQRQMPTMRALHLLGLLRSRDEARFVLERMRGELSEEAIASGYALLGAGELGPEIIFTRTNARTLDELKKLRLWRWDLDESGTAMWREMGFQPVTLPVETAARAYDKGELDGFVAIPTAALAFQWFHRAKFLLPLDSAYLAGCLLVASKSFEKLGDEHKRVLRAAAEHLAERISDLNAREDARLTGELFVKQGLQPIALAPAVRNEFFAEARAAREKLGDKLVPARLVRRVLDLLAEHRQSHATEGRAQ
jgi:TRAP-type C4-dicarboxylate transport system substrate-binding protein